jgi:hypothetical protein
MTINGHVHAPTDQNREAIATAVHSQGVGEDAVESIRLANQPCPKSEMRLRVGVQV